MMAETAQMSINERRKYLHKMRIRYWHLRQGKERARRALDKMTTVTELHRK
jgi:hypothetical protein